MSLKIIIRMNLALVLGVLIYGFLMDEPYWDRGPEPSLHTYLFWCALVLNGPSGCIAGLAQSITDHFHSYWGHVIEYGVWLLLVPPQWKGYDLVAKWSLSDRRREVVLYAAIAGSILLCCSLACDAWGDRRFMMSRIPRYDDWFVRDAALALSAFIFLAFRQDVKNRGKSDSQG